MEIQLNYLNMKQNSVNSRDSFLLENSMVTKHLNFSPFDPLDFTFANVSLKKGSNKSREILINSESFTFPKASIVACVTSGEGWNLLF